MLFVNNHTGQVGKSHVFDKQGVGPDQDVDFALFQFFQQLRSGFAFDTAGQKRGLEADFFQKRSNGVKMLFGENFRRCHDCRLGAAFDRVEHGKQGNDRLAAADVALKQSQHTAFGSLVAVDFRQHFFLCGGERKRQTFENPAAEHAVAGDLAADLLFTFSRTNASASWLASSSS